MKDSQSESDALANPSRKIKVGIIAGSGLVAITAEASVPGWGRVAGITFLLVGASLRCGTPGGHAGDFGRSGQLSS